MVYLTPGCVGRVGSETCCSADGFSGKKPEVVDYKNIELLKDFVSETGKIIPARITGTSAKFQRQVTVAVKRARFLALLSFTDNH